MKKNMLRIVLLGAALAAGSFAGFTQAADDATPPPAKTAERVRRTPADMIKNFRDQFEGLNLTDDQMKKIDGFIETAEAEIKKVGNTEDRDARRTAWEAVGKLNTDVQSVLDDKQKAALANKRQGMMIDRFKQAYTIPELKLTDDQTKKINDIIDEMKKQLPPPSTGTPDRETFQKIGQLMKETRDKLNAVLTPEQQKQIPPSRFGRTNRDSSTATPAPAK